MQKLLHLVFAMWTTNRPFDREHFPWSEAGAGKKFRPEETAAGHNRDVPEKQVVTAATSTVDGDSPAVNPPPSATQKPFSRGRSRLSYPHVAPFSVQLAEEHSSGRRRLRDMFLLAA